MISSGPAATIWKRYADVALHDGRFAANAMEALRDVRADLVVAHDALALRAGVRLARRDGAKLVYDAVEVPLVAERSGAYFRGQPFYVRRHMDRTHARGIARCDHVLTVGPSLAQWLEDRFQLHGRVTVVMNARPSRSVPRGPAIRTDLGLSQDDILVVSLNRVDSAAGFENVVAAVAHLSRPVHVALVGHLPGSRAAATVDERLASHARRHGIGERLHVVRSMPHDKLIEYAAGADLGLILLSRRFLNGALALPNRFFDALAAGLPMLSADVTDVATLVREYDLGHVFDADDVASIQTALATALEPGRLAASRRRVAAAAAELSWERERARLLSVVAGLDVPDEGHVCILARKDIAHNARVMRFSEALLESGHRVTVVGARVPAAGDACAVSGVVYASAGYR